MIFASSTAIISGGLSSMSMIFLMVTLIALMYFMMIRPQKKEQKRIQIMLSDLKIGDFLVPNNGFYGVVIDITEEDVIVEFGNNKNCRIPMKKIAIAQVQKLETEAAMTKKDNKITDTKK